MGFDQRLNIIDMISTSRSCEVFKTHSISNRDSLMCYGIGVNWETFNRNTSNAKRKKKAGKSQGKKKPPESRILIIPSRIYGEKLDVEVQKKGGIFNLIGGCKVTVEENIFVKKTSISSYIVPPNKRQDFPMVLQYQEFLISEVFLIFSKVCPKKNITYFIPSVIETNRFCYLISRVTDDSQWALVPKFEFKSTGITFSSDKWGYFAIIERQPFENINISQNGGLINTIIHPMVSIRIPKNSSPIISSCFLQYLKYTSSIMEEMTDCYPFELGNFLNVSSMISFGFPSVQFKRQVTIKLPLPTWAESIVENNENTAKCSELMLLCKRQGSWEPIDSRINYTKNTFTFESKFFGTFILVEPRSNREGKVRHSLSRLEYINNIVKGIILVFLYFETKSWYLWIELVSTVKAVSVRASREEGGLVFIEQFIPPIDEKIGKETNKNRRKSGATSAPSCIKTSEFSDGMVLHITLEEDVQFKQSTLNVPIISRSFQKGIDLILKKQSPVALGSLHKGTTAVVSDEGEHDDSEDDFLANMGKKKEPVIVNVNADDGDATINNAHEVTIIFYRTLPETYRILEIEPRKRDNLENDIIEKWKQKEIIRNNNIINLDDEDDNEKLNSESGIDTMESSDIHSGGTDMNESVTDAMLDGKVFLPFTPESKARTNLASEEETEHTFIGLLKITKDKLSHQLPPNQINADNETSKPNINEIKLKNLSTYIPLDALQTVHQYKFFIEPDEMREYIGIAKPTADDLEQTKQENADKQVNVYLKGVDTSGANEKLLKRTKKETLRNITAQVNLPVRNAPNESITQLETKEVQHKVNDRLSLAEMYKEPKVLSAKSLQVLSQYVEYGLTLAVHLDITDSVITGIGFDSVATNLTLAEATYKVFVHWKRVTRQENRPKMLTQLIDALRIMDLELIAEIVTNAANNNEELTKEHFQKAQSVKKQRLSEEHIQIQIEAKNKNPGKQHKSDNNKTNTSNVENSKDLTSSDKSKSKSGHTK